MTTKQKKYLNYIAKLGAELVRSGDATIENAIEKAIEKDAQMIENQMAYHVEKNHLDFENPHKKEHKAINIISKSIYNKHNKF